MPREGVPAFDLAVRGLAYFHVRLRTGERDLHSGMFGGAALNAVHALMQTLEAVVAMPDELRAGVVPPTEEELALLAGARPGRGRARRTRARSPWTRAPPTTSTAAPSPGPPSTSTGSGRRAAQLQKTVLPVVAEANVSIRLAPGQDVEQIADAFERLLREAAPAGAELEVERRSSSPAGADPAGRARRPPRAGRVRARRRPPAAALRSGGTIPLVPALADRGIPTILTGFALPDANMHSPNERLLARYVPLGVEAARETLVALGELR